MTTRCVADFLCGKNQCVRFLISIAVPEVPYDRAARNKVRRSLYLQRSFSEIFVDGRGCGKRLVGGRLAANLREWGLPSSTISPRERIRSLPNVENVEGRCEMTISVDVLKPRRMFPRTTLSEEGSRQEVASSNIKIRGCCRMLLRWRVVGADHRKVGSLLVRSVGVSHRAMLQQIARAPRCEWLLVVHRPARPAAQSEG
jgi:hypothetical protein